MLNDLVEFPLPGAVVKPSGNQARAQPACQARTKRGIACQSFALPSSAYCFVHDPEQRVARATARAKGGAKASKLRAIKGRRSQLATASELVTFTAGVIHDVREGKLEPDTARVVLYGVSIQRRLVEIADLERRLAILEERFGDQPSRGRSWRG